MAIASPVVRHQQPLPSTICPNARCWTDSSRTRSRCFSCRSAHNTFEKWQKKICACVVCAATAGIPPNLQLRVIIRAVVILAAAAAYALHELRKNFVFVDYIHADID